MSSEGVSEVLEKVAPVAMRGKQINDGSFQSGCNVGRFTEYENVWIMRTPPRQPLPPFSLTLDLHQKS